MSSWEAGAVVGREFRIGFVLLLAALLSGGCLLRTVNHLWSTRGQLLAFDENARFEASGPGRGPALCLLHPKLTREDVLALANGRLPSQVRKTPTGELWVFRWQRRPPMQGKAVNLELEFQHDLLVRLRVDKRFADQLGDARIEMLVRSFVGKETDLDVLHKRIVCRVPARENARFQALSLSDIRVLFGAENLIREVPLKPGEASHIYRYLLDGAKGAKAEMSFGASFLPDRQLAVISSKLGSFSLAFDLSARLPAVSR